jgi:hypothetical protein
MKWSELKRIAESKGWYLYRRGSRHDSQEVRRGLYYKLKRQMGF